MKQQAYQPPAWDWTHPMQPKKARQASSTVIGPTCGRMAGLKTEGGWVSPPELVITRDSAASALRPSLDDSRVAIQLHRPETCSHRRH